MLLLPVSSACAFGSRAGIPSVAGIGSAPCLLGATFPLLGLDCLPHVVWKAIELGFRRAFILFWFFGTGHAVDLTLLNRLPGTFADDPTLHNRRICCLRHLYDMAILYVNSFFAEELRLCDLIAGSQSAVRCDNSPPRVAVVSL